MFVDNLVLSLLFETPPKFIIFVTRAIEVFTLIPSGLKFTIFGTTVSKKFVQLAGISNLANAFIDALFGQLITLK
jgi:hypothetical protein